MKIAKDYLQTLIAEELTRLLKELNEQEAVPMGADDEGATASMVQPMTSDGRSIEDRVTQNSGMIKAIIKGIKNHNSRQIMDSSKIELDFS